MKLYDLSKLEEGDEIEFTYVSRRYRDSRECEVEEIKGKADELAVYAHYKKRGPYKHIYVSLRYGTNEAGGHRVVACSLVSERVNHPARPKLGKPYEFPQTVSRLNVLGIVSDLRKKDVEVAEKSMDRENFVISPGLDTYHKQGSGLNPACASRLHNTDREWRLTFLVDRMQKCRHPECFGGEDD